MGILNHNGVPIMHYQNCQIESCSRSALLVGAAGLARLSTARVLVAGIGGVGSYAVEALARAGVGNLTLIDADCIHPSNINRQLHALTSTIGRPKVEVMAERLLQINPEVQLTPLQLLLTPENIPELLSSGYDLVLDAIDTFSAKLELLHYCVSHAIPVISSMGAAGKLDTGAVRVADIAESHGCRLARKLRKELRKGGIAHGVTVVYSAEPCQQEQQGLVEGGDDTRRPLGSISYLPALFGLFMAGEAVHKLLGR
jgi:tRNA A37 threonylcarbamoyladenosine dehydratase